ncbi:MAG: malectin domain-containing carbohydrate-binding protein [Phycisphaerae bacterium]|nr:malectin domain-containing carbohydrate-binding protein [Phycisphaerae bacterium]
MNRLQDASEQRLAFMSFLLCLALPAPALAQRTQPRYFAHDAVEDRHGVIAPWHKGLNGQFDFRVRVAAETLKRYPWATSPKTGLPAPDYIYNGRWQIQPDGTIRPGNLQDWGNGDLAQRGAYAMLGWVDYYRYTGDPAAIAHISMIADVLLNHCQTNEDHPWPRFLISVPNQGDPYGQCNPQGMIQLDLVAFFGLGLVRGYQVTGNQEWLDAAKRWADLLAAKRSREPGLSPWNRYANPEDVFWEDQQTGGVVVLLRLFDELIRVGYTGANNALVEARDDGRAYLRDVLLPRWLDNDAFGRDYWDWPHQVQSETLSEMIPRYLMANPDVFPNWLVDARNIMSLFLQRASVAPESGGDVYSGAWAYPEGAQCCGRSLSYPPMQVGAAFAEYASRTESQWARELARRQFILATYDCHETGVVEDGMDGGNVVAGSWLQIAHPLPLAYVLDGMAWLPDLLGPNRENHIMRSTSVVSKVTYADGRVEYTTFDTPADTREVLRLAFRPTRILADGKPLSESPSLDENGYAVRPLNNGDCIVAIRHDGGRTVTVEGDDPQQQSDEPATSFSGKWDEQKDPAHFGGAARVTSQADASASFSFVGSQVRLIGSVDGSGGLADVYLDGEKQLCGIDSWNPYSLRQQVLYHRSGLDNGPHTLKVVALGKGNPLSRGASVCVDAIQFSTATGEAGFGEGDGPTGAQRWIFGYPGREDYTDSEGRAWRPATEVVIRVGETTDPVEACWYTTPRRLAIAGTTDPVIYRHGMHGKDFTAYVTVGPGKYHVRLKLMESRWVEPAGRLMDIDINGRPAVRNLDIAATASGRPASVLFTANQKKIWAGLNRAVDLVFNGIEPSHGVIAVRFRGVNNAEAVVSAVEVAPGPGGAGATPITAPKSSTTPAPR